jgi:hypothetical protein
MPTHSQSRDQPVGRSKPGLARLVAAQPANFGLYKPILSVSHSHWAVRMPPRPTPHLGYEHMFYLSPSNSSRAMNLRALVTDKARHAFQLTIAFLTLQDDYETYWDFSDDTDVARDALEPHRRQRRDPHYRPITQQPLPRRAGSVTPISQSCPATNPSTPAPTADSGQDEPRSLR